MKPIHEKSAMPVGACVSFRLGGELFAMPAACVREILEPSRLTRVPFAPPHMLGVVNVRGQATAVMDLGRRFGLPPVKSLGEARILILELSHEGEQAVVGGIADAVLEVFELAEGELAPAPSVAMRWRGDCVLGVVRKAGRFHFLLDISRLLLTEQSPLAVEAVVDETAAQASNPQRSP